MRGKRPVAVAGVILLLGALLVSATVVADDGTEAIYNWTSSTSSYVGEFRNIGTGYGMRAYTSANNVISLYGESYGAGATGMRGYNGSNGYGVYGRAPSGTGVYGESTSGTGIKAVSSSGVGLYASSTSNWSGKFVNGLGVNITNAGWHGIQIDTAAWAGVWVNQSGYDGFQVSTAGDDGLQVGTAGRYGVYVENPAQNGVYAKSAHDTLTGAAVRGENSATGGTALWGVGGYGVVADGSSSYYAGYFYDAIWVGSGCVGCALLYPAVNDGSVPLERGDIVAVSGVADPLAGQSTPVLKVRRATDGRPAIGVVQSRGQVGPGPNGDGQAVGSVEGAAAPGEYLILLVQGAAQVRVDASAGAIRAGDQLVAGDGGLAVQAQSITVRSRAAAGLGQALENWAEGQGLIWVLVDMR